MKKFLNLFVMAVAIIAVGKSFTSENPETLFGNVWFYRIGWVILAIVSIIRFIKMNKEEGNTPS